MGLDISAYAKVEFVRPQKGEDYGEDDDLAFLCYAHDEHKAYMDDLKPGLYKRSNGKDSFGFRAGSYSGYNAWRNWLCKKAFGVDDETLWNNPEKYEGKPFYELINFSDCEGVIGPKTSAKLAKDFADHEAAFCNGSTDSYDAMQYKNWRKAFELAAGNGAVAFH